MYFRKALCVGGVLAVSYGAKRLWNWMYTSTEESAPSSIVASVKDRFVEVERKERNRVEALLVEHNTRTTHEPCPISNVSHTIEPESITRGYHRISQLYRDCVSEIRNVKEQLYAAEKDRMEALETIERLEEERREWERERHFNLLRRMRTVSRIGALEEALEIRVVDRNPLSIQ